jgi:hypothetical protein
MSLTTPEKIRTLQSIVRRITQDEYDKKARELKQRQTEIALRIEPAHMRR